MADTVEPTCTSQREGRAAVQIRCALPRNIRAEFDTLRQKAIQESPAPRARAIADSLVAIAHAHQAVRAQSEALLPIPRSPRLLAEGPPRQGAFMPE